jgi:hypothetical protein
MTAPPQATTSKQRLSAQKASVGMQFFLYDCVQFNGREIQIGFESPI